MFNICIYIYLGIYKTTTAIRIKNGTIQWVFHGATYVGFKRRQLCKFHRMSAQARSCAGVCYTYGRGLHRGRGVNLLTIENSFGTRFDFDEFACR